MIYTINFYKYDTGKFDANRHKTVQLNGESSDVKPYLENEFEKHHYNFAFIDWTTYDEGLNFKFNYTIQAYYYDSSLHLEISSITYQKNLEVQNNE